MNRQRWLGWAVLVASLALSGLEALAGGLSASARPLASNVIVPQSRAFSAGRRAAVQITQVEAGVAILDQTATTTLEISLQNSSGARQEAELIVPVPEGAVVRGFTFEGAASEPTAQVLPKDEARHTYASIVAKMRDPALLEFVGYNLIRSSVFPVEARGTQRVRLTYEHLLVADGSRIDYLLPRSESLDYRVPWRVSVRIRSARAIGTLYSPTHRLVVARRSKNELLARVADDAVTEPGAFRLSFLLEGEGVAASLLAYPDPKVGGGYFLLLAGVPGRSPDEAGAAIKRDVTLILDRSGSMNGEKIRQACDAALQVLAGLDDGEAFNLIVYNDAVDRFSDRPVLRSAESLEKARAYIKGVRARGGTNIHDALIEGLRQKPMPAMLPVVLFLTDGLPTVGQTSEVAIREVAMKGNPYQRRIFTFGVGEEVNAPLLDKIASETRAAATYVMPKEDVEVKVGQVFKRLSGPMLADATLRVVGPDGTAAPARIRDLIPGRLPDLFEGDQLVVLGQYVGDEPLGFQVSGNYLGRQRTFQFRFALDKATTRNAFVPRLWASRKIGVLVDAIRQLGANGVPVASQRPAPPDPRVRELVEEIVRLSTEFGILTEYTAFLAREGTNLSARGDVLKVAQANLEHRAMAIRSGRGAVVQSFNNDSQQRQGQLNISNAFLNDNLQRVAITTVQQVNDRTFYRRGQRWVDSRLVEQDGKLQPKRVVDFGSEEFQVLVRRLAAEGRQGCLALAGDILLLVGDEPILVRAAEPPAPGKADAQP